MNVWMRQSIYLHQLVGVNEIQRYFFNNRFTSTKSVSIIFFHIIIIKQADWL